MIRSIVPWAGSAVLCLALLTPTPARADVQVMSGPTLTHDIGNWEDAGMQFTALVDCTLVSFRFENQGNADTAKLLDTSHNVLQSVSIPAGDTLYEPVVNWELTAGQTYRLIGEDPDNGRWETYNTFPTSNSHIEVEGVWSEDRDEFYDDWWFTFRDITTSSCGDVDGDGIPGVDCGGDDCDDDDPAVYPGADELCANGIDDDCDGDVDEDDAVDAVVWYLDDDGDGHGDASVSEVACLAPADHVADATDCDDTDPATHPGADEYCDGHDDDCDGQVDEDDAVDAPTWYLDDDGDGYGDPAVWAVQCDAPTDHVADGTDCNDASVFVHPGASESCNGLDDDCDGDVDEGLLTDEWYPDADGDGFGDASAAPVEDCQVVPGHVLNDLDCDDGAPLVSPLADELCNGVDDDCDGDVDEDDAADALIWYEDWDGDGFGDPTSTEEACAAPIGYVADAADCDDGDPDIHPGADELCNGVDDDCDGDVDEDDAIDAPTWYRDHDGDGYGDAGVSADACDAPPNFVADATDCNDGDPDIHPGADELCNGIDDDCDPSTYEQQDGDGDSFSVCDGDCDDLDVAVYPGAEEICNGIDDDCNPATPEDIDADGDGYTVCGGGDCLEGDDDFFPGAPELCDGRDNDCDDLVPLDEVDGDGDGLAECEGDCDDLDPFSYDGAPELCDQVDNDCDGTVDEDVDEDVDGDGYNACQGDCDNGDPAVYPGAPELCDGLDGDCDGQIPADEDDQDGDGWRVCDGDCDDTDADLHLDDEDADGWTPCDGDCDDSDDTAFPGADEICDDGADNDCDGLADLADEDCDTGDDDDTTGDDDDTTGDDDDSAADDDDDDDDDDGPPGDCQCGLTAGPADGGVTLLLLLLAAARLRRRT